MSELPKPKHNLIKILAILVIVVLIIAGSMMLFFPGLSPVAMTIYEYKKADGKKIWIERSLDLKALAKGKFTSRISLHEERENGDKDFPEAGRWYGPFTTLKFKTIETTSKYEVKVLVNVEGTWKTDWVTSVWK